MTESWPERVFVQGGVPLKGVVHIGGAKHSVLNILSALLVRDGRYVIHGFPLIIDAVEILHMLESIGVSALLSGTRLEIEVRSEYLRIPEGDFSGFGKLRSSVLLLGVLVARSRNVYLPMPGGDDLGNRPIDDIVSVVETFGVVCSMSHGGISASVNGPLEGNRAIDMISIFNNSARSARSLLDDLVPSNSASAMAIILAACNKGSTKLLNLLETIENLELLEFISKLGISVTSKRKSAPMSLDGCQRAGVGGLEVTIESGGVFSGSREGDLVEHVLSPDKCEIAFWAVAAAITGGQICCNVDPMLAFNLPRLAVSYKFYFSTLQRIGISLQGSEGAAGSRQEAIVTEYLESGSPTRSDLISGLMCFNGEVQSKFRPIDLEVSYGLRDEARGVIADASPHLIPLMMLADGTSTYIDRKFGRFRLNTFYDLRQASGYEGEKGSTETNRIEVSGPCEFRATRFRACNVRDGAAKLLYLLKAEGEGELHGFRNVSRAYDRIEEKLRSVGAQIQI